ncbi:DUF2971 domain-containing protein [Microbulbifer sp. HZ11]|uniref:DUF2971 domain-containing protein n=1 Tax=Microbulbifer sp. HZ11 TaxID=1453501 RepID=UPI0005BE6BE6|nr:DUF2971 domain-containing protein [Microbulbifer sp. HZ11]
MSKTLYKYLSLDNKVKLDRFFKILNGEIFLASPNTFNDPFELSPNISMPKSREIYEYFENDRSIKLNKSQKEIITNMANQEFLKESSSLATENWLNRFGILCLTEEPNNLLMWAHYGDSHRGVCIGFDSSSKFFSSANKIAYEKIRPSLPFNPGKNKTDNSLKKTFLTKSIDWSYEKEWRIVKREAKEDELNYYKRIYKESPEKEDEILQILLDSGGPGLYEFSKSSIRNIYLGSRISDSIKEDVIAFVEERIPSVKIFQLSLDRKYFLLNKEKIQRKNQSLAKG